MGWHEPSRNAKTLQKSTLGTSRTSWYVSRSTGKHTYKSAEAASGDSGGQTLIGSQRRRPNEGQSWSEENNFCVHRANALTKEWSAATTSRKKQKLAKAMLPTKRTRNDEKRNKKICWNYTTRHFVKTPADFYVLCRCQPANTAWSQIFLLGDNKIATHERNCQSFVECLTKKRQGLRSQGQPQFNEERVAHH